MKYLGGKTRVGKHIAPVLKRIWKEYEEENPKLDGYLEPFCGSLGVFRNMTNYPTNANFTANDYHPDLIQMWKEVKEGTFVYPSSISEEEYLAAKELESPNALKAFIGFGMSFGGRFFGAYSHKYLGNKKEDFCKEMTNSLKRTHPVIQNVDFTNLDYLDLKPTNLLIYCDPPYAKTKFPIKYRRDTKHYDVFDSDLFWETMRGWSQDNLVLISETTAPDDFVDIWSQDRYRSAAQSEKTRWKDVDSKSHMTEKLFIYNTKS